nr:hypothetical protein [Tanacetum cinerariifolium]
MTKREEILERERVVKILSAGYEEAGSYSHIYNNNEHHRYKEFIRLLRSNTHTTSDSFDLLSFPAKVALCDCKTKLQNLWGLVVDFQVTHKRAHSLIKTGTSTIVMKNMSGDNLLSLAYSFKDRVDPDVNNDTSEDEPTSSKQKWFLDLTGKVWCRLEANKGANWCLQTHVISEIKLSFKFSVLLNDITLTKLIMKGMSPVLKPKVCLSGVAKKKPIMPDIVNKCKQARHVEV